MAEREKQIAPVGEMPVAGQSDGELRASGKDVPTDVDPGTGQGSRKTESVGQAVPAGGKRTERDGKTAEPGGQAAGTRGKRRAGRGGKKTGRGKRTKRGARARRRRRLIAVAIAAALLMAAVSGVAIRQVRRQAEEAERRRYPMLYVPLIRAQAAQNDLSPAYVASVVLAESSYQPEAVSYADARGLMQLMPSTAEWIAGKLGETYDEATLFDPETNLRYGCWYLGFLMRRYGGDMRCASSAYHQGQGTVDKWLQNPEYSPDGATLSVIPSEVTETYVRRILTSYEKYEKLYSEQET